MCLVLCCAIHSPGTGALGLCRPWAADVAVQTAERTPKVSSTRALGTVPTVGSGRPGADCRAYTEGVKRR